MKLLVFKYRQKVNSKNRYRDLNIERLLFISVIIVFILMLFVQAALTSPILRTFLNKSANLEGSPLQSEEYLYEVGQIGLKLSNNDTDENIKILINGDEVACFDQNSINLSLKNGDVLEIDGSASTGDHNIAIVSKSGNVLNDCIGKQISVGRNVKKILKVDIN